MLRDLSELKVGDPVVHAQHGIGRYRGLVNLDLGEGMTEFLLLEYAGGDKLYVPVAQLHVIWRYSGAQPEEAPLHKLGGGQWDKAKRTRRASRCATPPPNCSTSTPSAPRARAMPSTSTQHDLEAFADGFGFEETPDQAAAIDAVIDDMSSGKPMDRLICGDVGFGKTEVALRAAFVAVADGKQVAVLCPTTLLAEQHFQTFSDRFADWPVKIAELSRFRTAKESTADRSKELADGEIDIVIGTHKLLSKRRQVRAPGPGDHRRGAPLRRAPEGSAEGAARRGRRAHAHRDADPAHAGDVARRPARLLGDRHRAASGAWRSRPSSPRIPTGMIREAVLRELKRGGQVYFLHNEVETIENVHDRLAQLLPEARIVVAHGQMRERELERVMREFTQQRHNLLLCSTIIETGIDIPNANTIVINRADKFGLAQLHQLRGRVGRSHHQAYAYLLTPAEEALSARRRRSAWKRSR